MQFLIENQVKFIFLNLSENTHFFFKNQDQKITFKKLQSHYKKKWKQIDPIVLVCDDGVESEKAGEFLVSEGFLNVCVLKKGL